MAIEKQVNIKITESGLEELNNELKQLDNNLENVSDEAQKTSKSVDDVASNGGAIAILDQLTGGLATRFKDAYEASKLFNTSLRATRGALIATGIGALVVALGTIVVLWDDIIAAIDDVNGKLEEQIELSRRRQDTLNLELDILNKQIDLAAKQGEANEELQKQRIALVEQLRAENEEEIRKLGLQAENLKATALELNTREKILQTVLNTLQAGSGDRFILDKQVEALRQYEDIQDAILEARSEQLDLDTKLFDLQNQSSEKAKRDREEALGLSGSGGGEIGAESPEVLLARSTANALIEIDNDRTIKEAENAAARAKFAELEAQQKAQAIAFANDALSATAGLLGEATAAGKAAALASALISTYQGINNVWAEKSESGLVGAGLAQRLVTTAIVAAQGFANVKKILAVKTPNGTGGGANAGAAVGQQPAAPSFNVVGTSDTNQLAQTLNQQQEPIQAFVVASDVTGAQAVNNNIIETATIS